MDASKIIRLRVSRYLSVHVDDVVRVQSSTGNDKRKGTWVYLRDGCRCDCEETVEKVRELIEDAKCKEEILLDALSISLLLKAAYECAAGRLHFAESPDGLTVTVGELRIGQLQGRNRSKYEHAEKQIAGYSLVTVESRGLYRLNERGYQLAEFLVAKQYAGDLPFSGFVKLPARLPDTPSQIGVQINQWNSNAQSVNNAVSETGKVEQSVK